MKELCSHCKESGRSTLMLSRSRKLEGDGIVLELRVAPEDMGKVIGRQGRIAKEIRTIVKSVAQRQGVKVSVEIVD